MAREGNRRKAAYDYPVWHQLSVNKKWISDALTTFRFLLQGEYQYLLNSDYLSGLHTGLEVTFLETIALRLGYYKEGVYNYNIPEVNKDEISAVTYGFGIQLPLSKVSKIPLNVSFDYTSLPQPGYTKPQPDYMNVQSDWENFNTFTLRVNYLFGK